MLILSKLVIVFLISNYFIDNVGFCLFNTNMSKREEENKTGGANIIRYNIPLEVTAVFSYLLEITQHLFEEVSVLLFFVFILAKTTAFRSMMLKRQMSWRDNLALIVFFGVISVMGTYNGMPVGGGALANTRPVGAIVGGLVAGPVVGTGAGILAAIHRLFIGGGPTLYASAISTIAEGLLAGLCYASLIPKKERWPYALVIGCVLETLHMALLFIGPSLEQALAIVQSIGLPMIIINSIGIAAFVAILDSFCREREKVEGEAAQMTLQIANKTLTYLRKGLNTTSAGKTVKIIIDRVENLDAVAITSGDMILAFEGQGKDHHRPLCDSGIITESTKKVLENGEYMVVQKKAEIGCCHPNCPLSSKVVVPLTDHGKVVGSLMLYRSMENGISPFEVELAIGLGRLISTQIEVSVGDLQSELRARAEIKALQAQINPHFLFNAINTIVYYCRKEPETARELLLHLGQFYRNNIAGLEEMVDLDTEIKHVDSYVSIELARFQGKLKVLYDIPPECNCLVPPLILQPIVENAIRHGIYPQKGGGKVTVSARLNKGRVLLTVEDDGIGMEPALVGRVLEYDPGRKTIGLCNVNGRLTSLYGEEYCIRIESKLGHGTRITVPIPVGRSANNAAEGASGR